MDDTMRAEIIRRLTHGPASSDERTILVVDPDLRTIGSLRIIDTDMARDPNVADELTRWREPYQQFFMTWFPTSPSRTAEWLTSSVLADTSRLLAIIQDKAGRHIGNFGVRGIVDGSAELDNLIRGERGGGPDMIHNCELSLIHWLASCLKVRRLYLHVMTHNPRTIALHARVGFVQSEVSRLERLGTDTEGSYRAQPGAPVGDNELGLVRMELGIDEFYRRHEWIRSIKYPSLVA